MFPQTAMFGVLALDTGWAAAARGPRGPAPWIRQFMAPFLYSLVSILLGVIAGILVVSRFL